MFIFIFGQVLQLQMEVKLLIFLQKYEILSKKNSD